MDNKKLIQELKELITLNRLKKREVEEKIGLPKNSLSNFLSEKKELPTKWLEPIKALINEGLVKSASEIPIPKYITLKEVVKDFLEKDWIKDVEKYCDISGATPQDLIDTHRNQNKPKKAIKNDSNDRIKQTHSDWRKEYIRNKTNYTPKD